MQISSSAYMGVETLVRLAVQNADKPCTTQGVPGEFLTRPEILVKCVRVRTTATYLSTCPGRINSLARETSKPRISAAIAVLTNHT